jgi:hypothetical protein
MLSKNHRLQPRGDITAASSLRVDESHGVADANRPAAFHVRVERQAAAESDSSRPRQPGPSPERSHE